MAEPKPGPGGRKPSKEPAASALTETPRVDGPGADRFGIQEHLSAAAPPPFVPQEQEDWGLGLIDLIGKPGWEYERATALLRIGATMPQIEQHLVAKGLSLETAALVTERVFEDRVRERFTSATREDRATRRHRLASLIAGCVFLGLGWWTFGARGTVRLVPFLLVYLLLIWFGHLLGWRTNRMAQQSPTAMMRWVGWILFLVVALRLLLTGLALARR